MIDYTQYPKALKHLQLQFVTYRSLDDRQNLSAIDREAIADAIGLYRTMTGATWD